MAPGSAGLAATLGAGSARSDLGAGWDHVVAAGPGVTGPAHVPADGRRQGRDQSPKNAQGVVVRRHDAKTRNHRERSTDDGEVAPLYEVRVPTVNGIDDQSGRDQRQRNEGVEGEGTAEVGEEDEAKRLVPLIQSEGDG